MKRIIVILCLLAGIAQAQSVIIVTNNVLALPTVSTSAVAGTIRITEYLRQGGNPIDINNNTGQVFVTDIRDGAPSFSFNIIGTNVVSTNGQIRYAFTLSAGPTYDVRTFIYPQDGSPRYASGIYSLTVTSATAAATSVTINQTNLISVTNDISVNATSVVNLTSITTNQITANATSVVNLTSITTNQITVNATSSVAVTSIQTNNNTINVSVTNITQSTVYTSGVSSISLTGAVDGAITFAGSGVTQTGNVFNFSGGGGSGNITIEGVTTNVFDFVGQFPVTVSNIGNTIYFGQLGGGGTFIPAGTSNQVFNFVPDTTQTFTVPSGVTQLYAYAWGAGGGGGGGGVSGGAGGYSFGYFTVTNSEVLSVVIGQGGFVSSTTTATSISTNTLNPFPNGGWGASKHTGRAGAGGGSTAILRATNYLVVAGGGGGGGSSSAPGGGGGGISGQTGFSSGGIGGGGGTQSAGGSTGSTAIPLSITNTAGSFYLGGNAGLITNLIALMAGGGGGGLYGGGGALALTGGNQTGSGGGGSGYINNSQGVQGTTVQAQTPNSLVTTAQPPPATDDPLYGSPLAQTWGRGGASATAGSNGGMIIRWVAP